ncbi:MAG TPA: hypothetical protein VMG34_03200 [Bacteroidota bacterium]|nr:hypothetical protein [Bacteroidota bacterium]
MKPLLAAILSAALFAGCSDSPGSGDQANVGVGVAYEEGFRGDSIVLRCDGVVVDAAKEYSGKDYAVSGSLFSVKAGEHKVEVQLPLLGVQSETTFTALPSFRTYVESSFDRGKKTISLRISYLDTEKVSFPQSPGPSLRSIMPR